MELIYFDVWEREREKFRYDAMGIVGPLHVDQINQSETTGHVRIFAP